MARLPKIRKKKTNNPALDNHAQVFSWKFWKKKRKFREFTSPIRTALTRYFYLLVEGGHQGAF